MYSKWKKGLLKKVKELFILCGVDVVVMCYYLQMVGVFFLFWGQFNLDFVFSCYKGVVLEECEKWKLDNIMFLYNQVQKLVVDLYYLVDYNCKLVDYLENFLWDDCLNFYSVVELQ